MWVVDFEASGLHRFSYPIEVAITNGHHEYHSLIRPMAHWKFWNEETELIHGVNRHMLAENGIEASEVAQQLNERLAGQLVYCDAIPWDGFWARVLFSDNGMHQRFSLSDVTPLFQRDDEIEAFLSERSRLQNSGNFRLHRALDDARILWRSLAYALPQDISHTDGAENQHQLDSPHEA